MFMVLTNVLQYSYIYPLFLHIPYCQTLLDETSGPSSEAFCFTKQQPIITMEGQQTGYRRQDMVAPSTSIQKISTCEHGGSL